MNGPTQTGLVANPSPTLSSCVGDRTRGLLVKVESRAFRRNTTVYRPDAVTLPTDAYSPVSREAGWFLYR